MSLSELVVPVLLCFTACYALGKRVDVYTALTRGAEEGLNVLVHILPSLIALLTAVFEVLGLLLCAAKAEGAWDTQAVRLCMVMAPLGLLSALALPRLLPMDSLVMALTNLLPMPPTVKIVSTTIEPVMM